MAADSRTYSENREWSCVPVPEKGAGLVLKDVRHWNYLFARDVRVTRLWVGSVPFDQTISSFENTPKRQANLRPLALGSDELPLVKDEPFHKILEMPLKQPFNVSITYPFRPTELVGHQNYYSNGPALLTPAAKSPIFVRQDFLVTEFSIDPPHEAGALIHAARFYPLLTFFVDAATEDEPSVNYVRVDYRIEFAIEKSINNPEPGSDQRNSAGVFTDSNDFKIPLSFRGPASTLSPFPLPSPSNIKEIFALYEKPIAFELLGLGLAWTSKDGTKQGVWDSIHIWPTGETASTPGTAHAIHMHWRWGPASGSGLSGVGQPFILPAAGQPQFLGYKGKGTPLIDPRLEFQTLRFAITDGGSAQPAAWKAERNPSERIFGDLFKNERTNPGHLSQNGNPLVVWLSFEAVRRPSPRSWSGTFFPHGVFFAHQSPLGGLFTLGRLSYDDFGNWPDPPKPKEWGRGWPYK